MRQDDLSNEDIAAYSQTNSEDKDDEPAFSFGGAIMEAIESNNPGFTKAAKKEQVTQATTKAKVSAAQKKAKGKGQIL